MRHRCEPCLKNNLTFDLSRLDWDQLIAETKGMSHCDIARARQTRRGSPCSTMTACLIPSFWLSRSPIAGRDMRSEADSTIAVWRTSAPFCQP